MPGDLRILLDHMPAWLVVFVRITGLFLLSPLIGSSAVSRTIKAHFAVAASLCVYPLLMAPGSPARAHLEPLIGGGLDFWQLAPVIALELLIGFFLGFCAALPMLAMQMGGQVMDQQMGIAAAGVFDPDSGGQRGVTAQMLYLLALTIFIVFGGQRVIFSTLVNSFDHVAPGVALDPGMLLDATVGAVTAAFELAVRVSAPMLCLFFLEMVAMGFVARTVPQLNIFSIGFAIKIMVGLLVLMLIVQSLAEVYRIEMVRMIERAFAVVLLP